MNRVNSLRHSIYIIRIEEKTFKIKNWFQITKLITNEMVMKHKKSYNFVHIKLVQIRIKPLSIEGINTAILAYLRDCRFNNFRDSLLWTVEFSLCNKTIYFNCYPNYITCFDDQNILDVLTLNIKTFNYDIKPGSIPITCIYKVQYKVIQSAFKFGTIRYDQKGYTILFQTDLCQIL